MSLSDIFVSTVTLWDRPVRYIWDCFTLGKSRVLITLKVYNKAHFFALCWLQMNVGPQSHSFQPS
jgi:hypothetical protein